MFAEEVCKLYNVKLILNHISAIIMVSRKRVEVDRMWASLVAHTVKYSPAMR